MNKKQAVREALQMLSAMGNAKRWRGKTPAERKAATAAATAARKRNAAEKREKAGA